MGRQFLNLLRRNRGKQLRPRRAVQQRNERTIMSRILKSFAELSWQVVAPDVIDDRDVSFRLLARILPRALLGTGTPLVAVVQNSRELRVDIGPWHHGGINE